MARPTEYDDEHLLAAADKILLTEGPSAFTLAKAATEAGVSAATYVKRFGSRDALFLRLSQRWVTTIDEHLTQAAAAHDTPLARFRAVALHSYHDLDNADTASKQLATLAIDLQRDDMRPLLDVGWGHVRRHLAAHAADAVAAGELTGAPEPAQLARIVMGAMEGGCLAWSVHPQGSLVMRLADDLDALLNAWTPDTTEDAQKKERT
ncbi:TetR/AcrR family transcriptional regulator [Nocardioidaceae bacterium SCSIO 66511]|nr:TetR/AcrR family transcriptional regulator [Nocardioidaceae bacterium SCSIO 66511]